MISKREKFLEKEVIRLRKELAKYKSLGKPKLFKKDWRDLLIVWLVHEKKAVRGFSVTRSAELLKDSKELNILLEKYPNIETKNNKEYVKKLSVGRIRNIYLDFKKYYDPDQVFVVQESGFLTMRPTDQWKKLHT